MVLTFLWEALLLLTTPVGPLKWPEKGCPVALLGTSWYVPGGILLLQDACT